MCVYVKVLTRLWQGELIHRHNPAIGYEKFSSCEGSHHSGHVASCFENLQVLIVRFVGVGCVYKRVGLRASF